MIKTLMILTNLAFILASSSISNISNQYDVEILRDTWGVPHIYGITDEDVAFGFAFEVPVITVILVLTNVSTPKSLSTKRPYVIVGAFIIGMLLTPPDVISQTLLAIPIWLLFELGILFSKFIIKDRYNKTDIMHDAIDTKDKKEDKN